PFGPNVRNTPTPLTSSAHQVNPALAAASITRSWISAMKRVIHTSLLRVRRDPSAAEPRHPTSLACGSLREACEDPAPRNRHGLPVHWAPWSFRSVLAGAAGSI